MKTVMTIASGALLLAAGPALAQDTSEPAQMDAPEAGPEVAPAEPEVVASQFSDSQIEGFAAAMVQIRELNADETLDDAAMRAQAEAIVAENGLDAETYNEIGAAAQSDPATARRIQVAVAEMQQGSDS